MSKYIASQSIENVPLYSSYIDLYSIRVRKDFINIYPIMESFLYLKISITSKPIEFSILKKLHIGPRWLWAIFFRFKSEDGFDICFGFS